MNSIPSVQERFPGCQKPDAVRTDSSANRKFLDKTQALAICGYKNEVDWVPSTAFELLVLSLMQDNEFSGRGIASIKSKIEPLARKFKKELEFIMVTNQEVS